MRTVGAWLGRLLVVGIAGQLIFLALGSREWLLESGSGQSFMLIFSMLVTLAFVGTGGRSLEAAGLGISTGWARHLGLGLVIGLSSILLYQSLALASGAVRYEPATAMRLVDDIFEGVTGGPFVAFAVCLIITGWLFGEVRRGWGSGAALAASCLFGCVLLVTISPNLVFERSAWGRFPTLIFVLLLLGALRQRTGDLVLPFAIAAGWLMVLRSVRKADLLRVPDEPGPLTTLLAPGGDVLAAPALWIVLGAAAFLALAWPRARETREAVDFEPIFKRLQICSHLGVLAPLDVWLGTLIDAKWKVDPLYLGRLAGVMVSSTVSVVVTLPERFVAPLLLAKRRIPPPLFILGVHRSGTTHLQNLLSLDPRFACARTRHVFDPFGFLATGWLMAPLLWAVLPLKRPQDSVKFGLFSPNEEEYALANMSRLSPDWSVRLPRRRARYDRYMFPEGFSERERITWSKHYRVFLAKLTLASRGRRPLLKNPYNTGRASMLAQVFPGAQFVHIHRDPFAVYRSYLHLARSAHPLFQLHDDPDAANVGERFCETYKAMEDRFAQDAKELPAQTTSDVRFEDLERDPITEIRRIYRDLGLEFTPEYERRLERYVEQTRSYKKNVYRGKMPDHERRMIETKLGLAPPVAQAPDQNQTAPIAAAS